MDHLRRRKIMRRPQAAATSQDKRGRFGDAVSIPERPAEAEDRALPGHWDGDLLLGRRHSPIATLLVRASRSVVLVRLAGRNSASVTDVLIERAKSLPASLMQTLIWDQGKKMAPNGRFTLATDAKVHFCDPASARQRGNNENTNELSRQYSLKA